MPQDKSGAEVVEGAEVVIRCRVMGFHAGVERNVICIPVAESPGCIPLVVASASVELVSAPAPGHARSRPGTDG